MKLEKFFATAYERHWIYVKRYLGFEKPWTKNELFQTNFFCNVFRDFDKTTRHMQSILQMLNEHDCPIEEYWKFTILLRFLSRISTYKEIEKLIFRKEPFKEIYKLFREMQLKKIPIVTNAFICNSKIPGGWTDKVSYIFILLKEIKKEYPDFGNTVREKNSLERTYSMLIDLPGVGPFMAYEYVTDFSYDTRLLGGAPDTDTWAGCGLGAMRGLSRVLYDRPDKKVKDYLTKFREIYALWKEDIYNNLDKEIWKMGLGNSDKEIAKGQFKRFYRLTMRDVEHWLCEYDKYCRGGSKKRVFNGG